MFLIWLANVLHCFPNLLAYDDACHLKRFICNPPSSDLNGRDQDWLSERHRFPV